MQENKRIKQDVALVLENGVYLTAQAYNLKEAVCAELVFNTSMVGYQEILTDESYTGQAIVFTMPHIGATGCNPSDAESASVSPAFIVVRSLEEYASNYRSTETLPDFLFRHSLPVVFNIDTRYLTSMLRTTGALRAMLIPLADNTPLTEEQKDKWLSKILAYSPLSASETTTCGIVKKTHWEQGIFSLEENTFTSPTETPYTIAIYDFGIKYTIARILTSLGGKCILIPKDTPAEDVLALKPHGICFSNGAGNPEDYKNAIDSAKILFTHNIPLLGICLGHQIFALALGAKTVKMKFGHHGGNHPVRDIRTNAVFITSQNHGFAVDASTLPTNVTKTHESLFDGSLQGFTKESPPLIAFQGHPEASPGPKDIECIFKDFMLHVANNAQ